MNTHTHTPKPTPTTLRRAQAEQRKQRQSCPSCAARLSRKGRSEEMSGSLAPPIVHEVLSQPGTPLDAATRAAMEPRFQHDFSRVRVHSGERAARSAEAVNALAYTVGSHVVFGTGQRPAVGHILAHELAHVAQNGHVQPTGSIAIEPGGSALERGADHMAQSALAGTAPPTPVGAAPGARLYRLGANPNCTAGQTRDIHQSIFNARGWIDKAVRKLGASPLGAVTLRTLRNNFGATHGTAANAPTVSTRLTTARNELSTIPFRCNSTATECTNGHCGFAVAGSHDASICTNVTLASNSAVFRAGCLLHESMHAAFPAFTGDSYGGWFGHAGATAGYPGADPLNNADSYTMTAMELS